MRRETISPTAGMTPPAGWGSWVQDADGAGGDVTEASGEDGVPRRSTCACPMCGLDLSSWTLPDRETHADACVVRALEGGTRVSPRETRGVRHDRPPRRAETNADTHAETDPSVSAGGVAASCDAFLDRHGLARYAPAFAREALFPSDLPSLTREDLRDVLGVRDERDAATFFAAVRGSRSFATDEIGAVRPFVSGDGGAERQQTRAEQTTNRQTSKDDDPCLMTTMTKRREEARLASLEQHDDEWTRLAMAMSASMRDAPRASSSFSSVPADSRRAEPSFVAPTGTRSAIHSETSLRDVTNERDARDIPRVKRVTRIAALPENPENTFRRPRETVFGETVTVLEAARALGRRSVPSSLWGAAGHGGRDREIPEWVLGGEKPRMSHG